MTKKNITLRFGVIALMVLLAALSRFLPHPPNFTPIGAMGLFGAAYFTRREWAFLVPLLALLFTDLILNNVVYAQWYDSFQWIGSPWVYAAFVLVIAMGFGMLQKITLGRVAGASILASVIFFAITNFGVWMTPISLYPHNFAGLMSCFAAGIPFFWNTLAGDLFFTLTLFSTFELLQAGFPKLAVTRN